MKELLKLQAATLEARARTGNQTISTSAKSGKIRVESITYDSRGVSTVTAMSKWLSIPEAINFLRGSK